MPGIDISLVRQQRERRVAASFAGGISAGGIFHH